MPHRKLPVKIQNLKVIRKYRHQYREKASEKNSREKQRFDQKLSFISQVRKINHAQNLKKDCQLKRFRSFSNSGLIVSL